MSAHDWTPGPWTMRGESVMAHRRHVCGGYNEESVQALSRPPAERLANARLIAAAPALYEALAGLVAHFNSGNDVPVERATISATAPAVVAARTALAQAEGSKHD